MRAGGWDPLRTLRPALGGRRLTLRVGDRRLALTVTGFDTRRVLPGLSLGQLTDVRVQARDICWDGLRFDRGTALAASVRLYPSVRPMLVATAVDISLDIPPATLDALLLRSAPRLVGSVDALGVARVRLARRPSLGHVEVAARLDEGVLRLRPRRLVLGRSEWRLPARTPAYRVRIPALPEGLELTGVSVVPGRVRVSARLPERRLRTGLF